MLAITLNLSNWIQKWILNMKVASLKTSNHLFYKQIISTSSIQIQNIE